MVEDDLGEKNGDKGEGGNANKIEGEVFVLQGIAERSFREDFPAIGRKVNQQREIEKAIGATIKRSSGHRVALLK